MFCTGSNSNSQQDRQFSGKFYSKAQSLVRVQDWVTMLCSWARQFSQCLSPPRSIMGTGNKMLGGNQQWTSIPSMGINNTPSRLHATEAGISSSSLAWDKLWPVWPECGFTFLPKARYSFALYSRHPC